jgi:hypothetical protein
MTSVLKSPMTVSHAPTDDRAREDVDHERHVDEAGPCRHLREVRDPELIGPSLKSPFTRSAGRLAVASRNFSRRSWRHTLSAPYTDSILSRVGVSGETGAVHSARASQSDWNRS